MNRKPRPPKRLSNSKSPNLKSSNSTEWLSNWRHQLLTRRRFLCAAAGGSMAAMFPLPSIANDEVKINAESLPVDPWAIIDIVQRHLFPTEVDSPGAGEINALGYLKFVITDTTLDTEDREFITKGASWLEGMAQQMKNKSFIILNDNDREKVLQGIATSASGENWLATIMLYIVEALLTDPVYGGNTDQLGWKWLQHVPGFPRPPLDKTFPHLLS